MRLTRLPRDRPSGALAPAMTAESIDDVIADCVRGLERVSPGQIVVVIEPGLPDVAIDHTQIDQVITNVIENSVRHAPQSDEVRVSAFASGAMVQVVVSDHGPGFETERRLRPFEMFSPSGPSGVHGIGLAQHWMILGHKQLALVTRADGDEGTSADGLRGAMSHLRKRIGTGSDRPRIVTEPHVGYRLIGPD